ncbi:MAG: Inosose dehydratase [candidate division BRC1 bacterium ADurb.BinA364]|nr:MAG: Inosose dehydratase [candidate division BRC1 bacterium ADurb.BinA364]
MKIGLRSDPLKLKQDMPALIQWLAENGYESIDMPGAPDAGFKALCDKAGLAVGSFDSPQVRKVLTEDAAESQKAAEALKADISKAAGMGLKTLFACLVPMDKGATRAKAFEIWKATYPPIVEHAASVGVSIAIEPWPGGAPNYNTIGTTPEVWRAMFKEVPSPSMGLCYDPSHMVRLGIDYLRALREFGDRVRHVHAKDCKIMGEDLYLQGRMPLTFGAPKFKCSEGWWRYCIPGDGEVDWRAVAVQLEAMGYDGPLAVEPEDGVYMNDEEGNRRGLRAAQAYLRSVIR